MAMCTRGIVRVHLGRALGGAIGRALIELDVEPPVTAKRLQDRIAEEHPFLQLLLQLAVVEARNRVLGLDDVVPRDEEIRVSLPILGS